MAMQLAPGTMAWPDNAIDLGTDRVIEMYKQGFAGAFRDPEASDRLDQSIIDRGGMVEGEQVASRYGFEESGAGKLVVLHPAVVWYYGLRALTKPGQKTGDCVSMAGRDVCLYLICLEALAKLPDEVSGRIEQPPEVSDVAAMNGVFVNEGIYLHRGHNGQGMSCTQGVHYVTTEGGIIPRKKYDQVDLEKYNVNFEVKGRSGSPQWLDDIGRMHPIRDVTRPRGHEAARDFISGRGKPIWTCSGLGFDDTRDEFGFSRRKGGWSHSWHVIGYDDRDITKQKYRFPLALVGHRWAVWNHGGRKIYKSAEHVRAMIDPDTLGRWKALDLVDEDGDLLIPEGYWWIDARLLDECDMFAVSGAAGWESTLLPDYLGGF